MKILLVDNFDSFTFNLEHYLLLSGLQVITRRNTELPSASELEDLDIHALVISPGPMRPEDHPGMIRIVSDYMDAMPILGICLGMQAIGLLHGWTLKHAPIPVHGKTSMIRHEAADIFQDIPQPCQVMRYHSLVIDHPYSSDLKVTASTLDDQLIMGVQHLHLPVTGLQFHPESILTPSGQLMLNNWANLLKKDK